MPRPISRTTTLELPLFVRPVLIIVGIVPKTNASSGASTVLRALTRTSPPKPALTAPPVAISSFLSGSALVRARLGRTSSPRMDRAWRVAPHQPTASRRKPQIRTTHARLARLIVCHALGRRSGSARSAIIHSSFTRTRIRSSSDAAHRLAAMGTSW